MMLTKNSNELKSPKKGLFIVFEGIDGAGKTSILKQLLDVLKEPKLVNKIFLTREPGGKNNTAAELIRDFFLKNLEAFDPLTLAYLYASSRAEHVKKTINPNLEKGHIVISDRFVHSSYIYQGIVQNQSLEVIHHVNQQAIGNLEIDYIFYFDVSVNNALNRMKNRFDNTNAFDSQNKQFYEKLLKQYPSVFNAYNQPKKIIFIDANKSENEVLCEVKERLLEIFKEHKYI
ncbi:dTMP kinase [Ureaplasma urealyticum]|uniref:Thymidylate kinase n=3 Tax=Ureaplasma urealyticum TaxID=2130 RepID=A0AAP9AC14_UREUR|nr:dTMP kinase [Ureaplasma urealyticum]EDX54152.1 thymidylate kinase [Ureaplasma urealyticum serovar 9 str. ATCC 33175]MCF1348702.1 dTMP kinase [Ureaplasma urealyticum]MDU3864666.1 dTMP kinase [Ureaplasma urealyticum]QDI63402.1 dTMP kinase [Ureaplasma urealyticum]QDI64612.1 dTMP kinase [Ureaplasma urealyticum]